MPRPRDPSPAPAALPTTLALRPPRFRACIAALALLASFSTRAASPKPQSLFNGHDLAGWHTWLVDSRTNDPRGVFTVSRGLLRISGDGLGYLATDREFENYRLELEWRWGSANTHWNDRLGRARDSGVFLHATGPDGNSHDGHGAFMAAIECNLFQGATGDFLLIRGDDATGRLIAPRLTTDVALERDAEGWFTWRRGGRPQTVERWGRVNWYGKSPDWRDVTDFRGPRDIERRPGLWNRLVCESQSGRLRLTLNGVVVNQARDVSPRRGRILLQCEGSEIHFRRVALAELPPSPD